MARIKVTVSATLLVVDQIGNTCEFVYQDSYEEIQVCGMQVPNSADAYNAIDIESWTGEARHFGTDDYCEKFGLAYSCSTVQIEAEVELDQDYRPGLALQSTGNKAG